MTIHIFIFAICLLFATVAAAVCGFSNLQLHEENDRLRQRLARERVISAAARKALCGSNKENSGVYTEERLLTSGKIKTNITIPKGVKQ